VVFTPWVSGDPVATQLDGYTCTPEHRTVRVAHMFVTSRRWRVLQALANLKASGCNVRIVLSQPSSVPALAGVQAARDDGLSVQCTPSVHDKIVMVDAVRKDTGIPERALWIGSQSLGGNALHINDEALLRVSVDGAKGQSLRDNSAVYAAYGRHWSAIQQHHGVCATKPSKARGELTRVTSLLTANPNDVLPAQ